MTPTDLLAVLREFHREKLTMRQRHVAVAKLVGHYEFNNTYQYIISREDVHLQWLEAAITELGATPDEVPEPALSPLGKKDSFVPLVIEDLRTAEKFASSWRPRVATVTNARHRSLLGVIIGETLEQKRFFDQIVEGQVDLLGRRSNGPGKQGTGDGVMGVRWVGKD